MNADAVAHGGAAAARTCDREGGSTHRAPLAGRCALVTGAARGIGAAICERLAEDGARLVLVGRRKDLLDEFAARLSASADAHVLVCDVADADAVRAAWARLKAVGIDVDVLVNNAGQAHSASFVDTDDALWRDMMAVNLDGCFHWMKAVLPDMLARRSGRIVNVASTAGQRGYAYVSAYAAAKHAVIGLTRSVALEVARKGVTVNAVCPGFTQTDLLEDSVARIVQKTGRSAEEARAELARGNPQGRLVQPREVADAVAFLCTDAAASIHGQSISVSGGEVM